MSLILVYGNRLSGNLSSRLQPMCSSLQELTRAKSSPAESSSETRVENHLEVRTQHANPCWLGDASLPWPVRIIYIIKGIFPSIAQCSRVKKLGTFGATIYELDRCQDFNTAIFDFVFPWRNPKHKWHIVNWMITISKQFCCAQDLFLRSCLNDPHADRRRSSLTDVVDDDIE